jgi:hypothetical protein
MGRNAGYEDKQLFLSGAAIQNVLLVCTYTRLPGQVRVLHSMPPKNYTCRGLRAPGMALPAAFCPRCLSARYRLFATFSAYSNAALPSARFFYTTAFVRAATTCLPAGGTRTALAVRGHAAFYRFGLDKTGLRRTIHCYYHRSKPSRVVPAATAFAIS